MRMRRLGAALTMLALTTTLIGAGCTAGTGSAPEPEPSSSTVVDSAGPETPAAPEPLSKDAYQKLLTGSETTIRKAFDKVMAAKSLDEVEAAAKTLAASLDTEAGKFSAAVPPDAAVTPHGLATSLLSGSDVTTYEAGDNKPNACGIRPTATEQVIKAQQQIHDTVPAAELKQATSGYGKAGYTWGKKLLPGKPETPKGKKRRADNGEIVERNGGQGSNVLQITNDTDGDVVIAAVTKNPKKPMASIYVRAGRTTTLEGLAAKKYTVYYKSGTDWDDDKRTFTRSCAFSKFRQSFTPESNWQIELKPRIGGNAPTDQTDPF